VVAAVTHPALDLAAPTSCDADLAPIFDPWSPDNDAADLVRRPAPWLLIDSAHTALGWPLATIFPWPYGYPDEALLAHLGVPLDEVELGARSTDLVAQLAWEDRYAAGEDPALGDSCHLPRLDLPAPRRRRHGHPTRPSPTWRSPSPTACSLNPTCPKGKSMHCPNCSHIP
jgi:hypothetical protein